MSRFLRYRSQFLETVRQEDLQDILERAGTEAVRLKAADLIREMEEGEAWMPWGHWGHGGMGRWGDSTANSAPFFWGGLTFHENSRMFPNVSRIFVDVSFLPPKTATKMEELPGLPSGNQP